MPKPVCFMIMPFGKKKTGAEPGRPAEIAFDTLWTKALAPAIEELGFEPVRADQDLGAMIINEMIERLALSDLVIADMTIPNGNVYYEVGIRHAAARSGCVMIAADWATPLFDVAQMRQVRYPLAEGSIDDATAGAIRTAIVAGAKALAQGISPVYEALPGYPKEHTVANAASFRRFVGELNVFRAAEAAVAVAPESERRKLALSLRDEYAGNTQLVSFVALEIIRVLRDYTDWSTTLAFIEQLPAPMQGLAVVKEQRALAQSKTGDPLAAIRTLEELILTLGDTSERQGLLGGRYKVLYERALGESEPAAARDATRFLDKAIEHYERGMLLDLNDYYPSSNLPRLYRLRGNPEDPKLAEDTTTVALAACERARKWNPKDDWVRPTLLGLMFDAGRISEARSTLREIDREGAAAWKLETTLHDLERSIRIRPEDDPARQPLLEIIDALHAFLPRSS